MLETYHKLQPKPQTILKLKYALQPGFITYPHMCTKCGEFMETFNELGVHLVHLLTQHTSSRTG